MKTQISALINGSENTVRDINAEKYIANPIGHFCGKSNVPQFGGSTIKTREEVSRLVSAENPAAMKIKANGVELKLDRYNSLSGKSWSWSAPITAEMFERIFGFSAPTWSHKGAINTYTLTIDQCCTVSVYSTSGKKEHRSILGEEFIEIL